jgi:hypothetical protein
MKIQAGAAVHRPGLARSAWQAARRPAVIAGLAFLLLLLPTWLVGYVPLYDYQNHLLEAKAAAHYTDPQMEYSSHYLVREGWWLRSNALSTLVMILLIRVMPAATAGKLALTLYFALLSSGMALLLHRLGRPPLLLLALPLLAYNFTYTMGLLNWSYGFALLPWAAFFYLEWQEKNSRLGWLGLAAAGLLAYLAHVLAWGVLLGVIAALAAAAGLPLRRWAWLAAALSAAVPLLLLTRPILALAPLLICAALFMGGEVVRRLRLGPLRLAAMGAAAVLVFFAGFYLLREPIRARFPDLGYSPSSKLAAPFQLFSLPHYAGAEMPGLEAYNAAVLLLAAAAGGLLLHATWRGRPIGPAAAGWAAAAGLLGLAYFLIPTRTADIITTEPRLLLAAAWAGLLAARLPSPGTLRRRLLGLILALLAVLVPVAALLHARSYDEGAQRWAQALAGLPPRQRLLALAEPLPAPPARLPVRLGQVFDQLQFSNTYALEHGGFVSTTFFNGPLLPIDARAIPPYWWDGFNVRRYLAQYCERLDDHYDLVVVWNPRSERLLEVLQTCYGEPLRLEAEIGVWQVR